MKGKTLLWGEHVCRSTSCKKDVLDVKRSYFNAICRDLNTINKNFIEKLFPEDTVIRDKSVLAFTPALCASMQTALCVKLLTGRAVQTGTIYYFDLLNQEYEVIPIVSS